jgi:hypothetical protein
MTLPARIAEVSLRITSDRHDLSRLSRSDSAMTGEGILWRMHRGTIARLMSVPS